LTNIKIGAYKCKEINILVIWSDIKEPIFFLLPGFFEGVKFENVLRELFSEQFPLQFKEFKQKLLVIFIRLQDKESFFCFLE
jgi:hypothetical protein